VIWEPCDDFTGPWRLAKVSGYEPLGETELYFWGHDGTGEIGFAGMIGNLACEYGETLDGFPAVTFKLQGTLEGKSVRGSGLAAIERDGRTLSGSLKIGRRASAFVAHRE
jgi:hypothetical protein